MRPASALAGCTPPARSTTSNGSPACAGGAGTSAMAHVQLPVMRPRFGETTRTRSRGGCSRSSCFFPCPRSSSTRRGRRSRASTTRSGPTSRRSTRRSCSAIRRTPGSGRSRPGGRRWLAVLAGAADPAVPRAVPLHLLLLPRRLLQGVLGRSARVRGRRAAQELPGRGVVSAHDPEHPPLLPLHRARLPRHPRARRLEGVLVHRPGDRRDVASASASARSCSRRTSSCSAATRSAATRCATSSAATSTGMSALAGAQEAATTARAASTAATCAGRGEPVLGRLLRPLRPALLDGHLDRLEDLLISPSATAWRTTRPSSTTCSSSAPAAPGCARRSRPPRRASPSASSASRCSARRTR